MQIPIVVVLMMLAWSIQADLDTPEDTITLGIGPRMHADITASDVLILGEGEATTLDWGGDKVRTAWMDNEGVWYKDTKGVVHRLLPYIETVEDDLAQCRLDKKEVLSIARELMVLIGRFINDQFDLSE